VTQISALRSFDAIDDLSSTKTVEIAARVIENDGAILVRRMVPAEQTSALKEGLIRALREDESLGPNYIFKGMVHALMTRGKGFLDLLENPVMSALRRLLLGNGCIVHGYNSSSMPPRHTNYSRTIHVDAPRLIEGYITNVGLTIPLDPFTDENGAMEIAPSLKHLKNAPEESLFDSAKIVLNDLRPGDCIFFNARCWHRGGVNHTDQWRHAVTVNICRAFMRQQFDFPRMLGLERAGELSNELQQFLGYWVRSPQNMDEFRLPPDERPYRPGQE